MSKAISPELKVALEVFARQETILIALDFDGTLAPLVDDPEASRMITPARKALEQLTTMPGVTIALVTGRAIDSVKRVAEPLNDWFLVGSHGIEVLSPGEVTDYETRRLVPDDLINQFEAVVAAHPGTRLEHKPFGLALHTRGVAEQVVREAESAAHQVCDVWSGNLLVRVGHGIVECSIKRASKGDGIEEVRRRLNPRAVFFAGDDQTDEDGFGILKRGDIGIKVGQSKTLADFSVRNPHELATILDLIRSSRCVRNP